MNINQKKLFDLIVGIFSIENIEDYYSEAFIRYGILNYIARYSLASDQYFVTKKSLAHLKSLGVLKENKLRRGVKSKSLKFTYEHPVPAKIIGDEIIKNCKDPGLIEKILMYTDVVTVLTKDENDILNQKFRSRMPVNWKFFQDSPFARYEQSGIGQFQDFSKIQVYGPIAR